MVRMIAKSVSTILPFRLSLDASEPRITARFSLARISWTSKLTRSIMAREPLTKSVTAPLPDFCPIHGRTPLSPAIFHSIFSLKSFAISAGSAPLPMRRRNSCARLRVSVSWKFITCWYFRGWFLLVQSLCGPATIHAQDGSSDERIFQQRDNRLCRFLDSAQAPYRMQAGQPIALTVVCLRFSDHAVHHRRLDRAKCNCIHADSLLGILQCRRARQPVHGMLGSGIHTETGHTDLSNHRRGVHNRDSIFEDGGDFVLHAEEEAKLVDIEGVPVILLRLLVCGHASG